MLIMQTERKLRDANYLLAKIMQKVGFDKCFALF